jgi:hypothetical protein
VVGTLILVEVERLPRGERRREPRVLWLWWHGPEGTAPELDLIWRLRQALRSRAHLALPQAEHGMDHAKGALPRAGRPLDVVGGGRIYPAEAGTSVGCGSEAALGAPLRAVSSDAHAGTPHRFGAFGAPGHARRGAETLR